MARPLRLQVEGALYHVTARGNRREAIYHDDADRFEFRRVLAEVCDRFNWWVYAWCQMGNHYHVLVGTPDGNLAAGMRQLNGVYTQRFNAGHGRVGHLFQGRYSAIMVEWESYLLEVARYVVLNPVRARMVRRPEEWPWSSYRASLGAEEAPDWLDVEWLLSHFGSNHPDATAAYRRFVEAGHGQPAPWEQLRNQVFLGSDAFVERMNGLIAAVEGDVREIPAAQRRPPAQPLAAYYERCGSRDEAIAAAYESGAYSLADVGRFFGLHYSRVSRIVARERKRAKSKT